MIPPKQAAASTISVPKTQLQLEGFLGGAAGYLAANQVMTEVHKRVARLELYVH